MIKQLLFLIILCSVLFSGERKIRNHPLIGTEYTIPDYALVLEGYNSNNTYQESPNKRNEWELASLDSRASCAGYPYEGLKVVGIVQPETPCTVTAVYHYRPNGIARLFNDGYETASLHCEDGYYRAGVFDRSDGSYEINFSINVCSTYNRCSMWRRTLKKVLDAERRGDSAVVTIEFYALDKDGYYIFDPAEIDKDHDGVTERFGKTLEQYSAFFSHLSPKIRENHRTVETAMSSLDLMNLFLRYELFDVKRVYVATYSEPRGF